MAGLLAAGLMACAGPEDPQVDSTTPETVVEPLSGLSSINGLTTSNGLATSNGLSSSNGVQTSNGLSVSNGLTTSNGLSSSNGLMTTELGRRTVAYLVRCALASGDSLTKQDQNGVSYTFSGRIGLAPGWKTGSCDTICQQQLSTCMLAHVNTSGVHIPLWLVSGNGAVGWGLNRQFPNREGTFFGNIFLPSPTSGVVDAFYCNGPAFSTDTVPGRLGALQTGVPYSNPYVSTTDPKGDCSPCSETRVDGPDSCRADGTSFSHPITVWRGQTFQAEAAALSQGLAVIRCPSGVCSQDERVGYIGPFGKVTFGDVFSATAGPRTLVVYYADGDSCLNDDCPRSFDISVNGGTPRHVAFPVVRAGDWNVVGSRAVILSGFVAGSSNTVQFAGDTLTPAPDLDWIEVE